jgi:hypothetical protein
MSAKLPVIIAVTIILFVGSSMVPVVVASSASPSGISMQTSNEFAGYEVESGSAPGNLQINGTWVIPTITSCDSVSDLTYAIGVGGEAAGTLFNCPAIGTVPEYLVFCAFNFIDSCPTALPPSDTMSPNDKIQAVVTINGTTKAASIVIHDVTKGWTYTTSGKNKGKLYADASWELGGGPNNLGMTFSTIKTSGDSLTMAGHTGKLGSFISNYIIYDWTYVDSTNNHTLAQPTNITSSSHSFKINFVQLS